MLGDQPTTSGNATDPEQFLTRALLESTLKDMKYVPTKLDAATQ